MLFVVFSHCSDMLESIQGSFKLPSGRTDVKNGGKKEIWQVFISTKFERERTRAEEFEERMKKVLKDERLDDRGG